jgi:hypothetical protein
LKNSKIEHNKKNIAENKKTNKPVAITNTMEAKIGFSE